MKSRHLTLLFLPLFLLSSCKNNVLTLKDGNGEEIDVIFIHGQSNADGRARASSFNVNDRDIYNHFVKDSENVFISSDGCSRQYNNFESCAFKKDMKNDYFGPEIGLRKYYEENFPTKKLAIIKVAFGGTILYNQWLYNGDTRYDLYNRAINFDIENLEILKSKNYVPSIKGICWMQGESDSCFGEEFASHYLDATTHLVDFFREDLKAYSENIRFVDAGISKSFPLYEMINEQKKQYSLTSENTMYFSTIDIGLNVKHDDLAHYDSPSMVKLGYTFGEYLFK